LAEKQDPAVKLSAKIDNIFSSNKGVYEKMERFMKRYKGEWWGKNVDENDSKIHANYIFSTVETVAPLLTDNRPIWSVRARQSFMQNHVEAFSVALEYLWDKLRMDNKLFLWVKNSLIMKTGIAKARWDNTSKEVAIDNVDSRTFFIAPGYTTIEDSPMCGERMTKPLSFVRFKYPKKFKEVTQAMGNDALSNLQDWELEDHKEKFYEVYLRDSTVEDYYIDDDGKETKEKTENKQSRKKFPNGKIKVMMRGVTLEEKPWPFSRPPYIALYDYTVPHEFWGMSEPDQIEEMNLSFNRSLQLMHTWMTSYGDPPWILDPNSGLTADDVKKQLKQGGAVFEGIQTGSQPILDKVSADPINQTVPLLMNAIQRLMEEVSGVTDVSKGQVGKSQRQSATEISTLIESAYTRMRQRVRNLEHSVSELLHLMIEMMQKFYSELREFQVQSDEGPQRFTVSNRNDFAQKAVGAPAPDMGEDEAAQLENDANRFMAEFGEVDPIYAAFDLTIDTNSTLPMDKQSKANMFLRLLEMAVGDPTTSMPMWKATLEALRLPRHRQIIEEMQQQMQQLSQQGQPQQGPPVQAPLDVNELMREAQ